MKQQDNFKIDFIGVGLPRAATTWMDKNLREHPQICMSLYKEPAYFNHNYHKGLEWYKNFFKYAKEEQIKGEYTPGCFFGGEQVINRIKEHNENIKIIICLRNPIERAYSSYVFQKRRGEKASFFKPLEAFKKGVIADAKYAPHLENWLNNFPRKNILFLFFEDIEKDPCKFINKICNFLGVEQYKPSGLEKKENSPGQKKPRIIFLSKLIALIEYFLLQFDNKLVEKFKDTSLFRLLQRGVGKVKNLNFKKVESPPKKSEMDPEFRSYVREYFKEDIQNVEKLINKDLSHWK